MKANTPTKTDIAVLIAAVVFMVVNIGAIGNTARERAKRQVCFNNLKDLTDAWQRYAEDNGGLLVNGSQGFAKDSRTLTGQGPGGSPSDGKIKPWVGNVFQMPDWIQSCDVDAQIAMLKGPNDLTTVRLQNGSIVQIRGTNLLYAYCPDVKVFRCPTADGCEMLNYSIVDAMFGAASWQKNEPPSSQTLGDVIEYLTDIHEPSERFVFVDEGRINVDSWTLPYSQPEWWDPPPWRHDNGATFSFADGHAEYRKWTDKRTINLAKRAALGDDDWTLLLFQQCNKDLEWAQIHAWGELGYDPNEYGCD